MSINVISLQHVDSLNFLGVCIDHQITWTDHIRYISNKLSIYLSMFHRLDAVKIYDLIDFNTCISMHNDIHKLVPFTFQVFNVIK